MTADAAPFGCLVVEPFAPVRGRLVDELARKGLQVVGAVNHLDAVRLMATRGVPASFVVSAASGGLALARGLGKMDKTKTLPVILVFDDERGRDQAVEQGLPESVMPVLRAESVAGLVAALVEKLPPDLLRPGGEPAPAAETGGPKLSDVAGLPRDQIAALDRAVDIFDQIVTMIRQDKLPGPMIPDLLTKVNTFFGKADADFAAIAAFVSQHQTLAARLLAVANTAAYARGSRVTSIEVAVQRLGLRESGSQLRTIAARAFVVGGDPVLRKRTQAQLEAAYVVAVVAQDLAKRAGLERDDVYSIGLFHNIGPTFLLYTVALLLQKNVIRSVNMDALDTLVGSRAGELNALVAEKLSLPPEVNEIYKASRDEASGLVKVMHQGMWVAARLLAGRDPAALRHDMEAELLGLEAPVLDELRAQAPRWLELLEVYGR